MKVFKLMLFFLVMIFIGIVVFQNQGVFMDKKVLGIDLMVWNYQTPEAHLSVYFLGFFLLGLLVSYFYGLGERFRAKRTIAGHLETIRRSEEDIKALKNNLPNAEQAISPEESANG